MNYNLLSIAAGCVRVSNRARHSDLAGLGVNDEEIDRSTTGACDVVSDLVVVVVRTVDVFRLTTSINQSINQSA